MLFSAGGFTAIFLLLFADSDPAPHVAACVSPVAARHASTSPAPFAVVDPKQPTGDNLDSEGCGPVTVDGCPASDRPAEAALTPDAIRVARCIIATFGVTDIGGTRPGPANSDHTTGRAVDIMIHQWRTAGGNNLGWDIAQWARTNAYRLGVHYIIFDKRIWNVQRDAEGWRTYTRYGPHPNPTLGHLDHVHISVYGDRGQGGARPSDFGAAVH